MKTLFFRLLLIVTVLSVAGCSAIPAQPAADPTAVPTPPVGQGPTGADTAPQQPEGEVAYIAQSERPRAEAGESALTDVPELVGGNTAFAFDLYQALKGQPGNLFYSPYSISLALAMTYAGARGETEAEMAQAMRFALAQERLHPAFNALDADLAREVEGVETPFELNIANSIWGQRDYAFEAAFLDLLAENYGAGLRLVDYVRAAEEARQQINAWVEDETQDKIKDLIPQGALDDMTRLVLANAIYFKAAWSSQFEEDNTREAPFTLLDGSTVDAPTMHQSETLNYASGEGWQAVELYYEGNQQSMLILLPGEGQFEAFEAGLDTARLESIFNEMQWKAVELALPKFSFESEFELNGALSQLGMPSAFSAERADFSGMTGDRELYISDVVHKAFVDVNEEGTEAAAATAVIMRLTSAAAEPVQMQVDRPFIFLIRDVNSGSILFAGRVVNPLN